MNPIRSRDGKLVMEGLLSYTKGCTLFALSSYPDATLFIQENRVPLCDINRDSFSSFMYNTQRQPL